MQLGQAIPDGLAAMPPGPDLAAVLAAIDLTQVCNDDIDEVMLAHHRQLAHHQAHMFAAISEVVHRRPFAGKMEIRRGALPDQYGSDEIRFALAWNRRAAEYEMSLAVTLVSDLPQVQAFLCQGRIDRTKARVFAQHLADLPAAQRAAICEAVLPHAPKLTTGQIGERIKRLILELDPAYYERRYRKAIRDRLVVAYLTETGTAVISAEGLPAEEAAAAWERLDALAKAARRDGHPGTIDQIRADLVLGLLDGSLHGLDRAGILRALMARFAGHADNPTTGSEVDKPAAGTPAAGRPASGDPASGSTVPGSPAAGRPASGGADAGGTGFAGPTADAPGAGTPGSDEPAPEGPASGSPTPAPVPGGPGTDGPTPSSGSEDGNTTSDAPGASDAPGSSDPDTGHGSGASGSGSGSDSDSDSDDPDTDDQGPTDPGPPGSGPGPGDPRPDSPNGGGAPAPPDAGPDPSPTVPTPRRSDDHTGPRKSTGVGTEVRVPLTTLLGLDQRAGELPGWGPIPASAARRLVARQHRAQWRWVVVDERGHLLAEGITRHRPTPRDRSGPRGGIVELHIPAGQLVTLAADAAEHGGWAKVITDIADQYRQHTEHDDPGAGLDDRPDARFPHAALRRHTEVRDRTCLGPGCRTAARRCDQDHTRDHHHGGPTVRGGLGPLCRHDHTLKTKGNWCLDQPEPGHFIWTSPLKRQYRVEPEPILPPPITPVPRDHDSAFDNPAPGPVYADDEQPDLRRSERGPPAQDGTAPEDTDAPDVTAPDNDPPPF
ncbi:protein of unknown function [Pseudonocardia ammonioxydans]|uniref:DUF222 domain-containing protein n=1 Tax=Pseudonocardia ammonioxydans TaxID=260086 RepID=A0A1I4WIC0_PSUAM|nr:HNH endonuclease signature motif containing protein [Pseudonocardia ammonioxydans]SFN12956.1 protein of unknown function [Pseudonocardia ammonioxydans]